MGEHSSVVEVARARWRDLADVYRAYRFRTSRERLFYHPFPFDPIRLSAALTLLVAARRAVRLTYRVFPRVSAVLLVARHRDTGQLLGFGTLNFRRDGREVIGRTGLWVAPDLRRHGVGRALEAELIRLAQTFGVRRAEADILTENEASLALYGSLGYRFHPVSLRDRRAPSHPYVRAEVELTAGARSGA